MPNAATGERGHARWLLPRVLVGVVAPATGVVLNVVLSVLTVANWEPTPFDWAIFTEAANRFSDGRLYEQSATYAYRYSPVLAPALAALGWIGPIAWRALHIVAALALPSWRLRVAALLSWPFWFDTSTGNVVIFMVLAAAWALRGSTAATGLFLAAAILVPRPLMFPIAAWLLWRRAEWRVPFGAMFVVHAVAVLLTGWGDEWIGVLASSADETGLSLNLAPSRWIGLWWMVVALPAAAWLTLRGRLGWASLLAAPYWLPYYLLMPILELDRRAWRPNADAASPEGGGADRSTRAPSSG